jgi:peptide-methionine (S)-S-oxide reductase
MTKKTEKATFAAGCFWHVQYTFDKLPGIISTSVGYAGGQGVPNYETAENKGFAEAIQIEYDPKTMTYGRLLDAFWDEHDPTSLNRQGADVGKRYRSVIFYHDEMQKSLAQKSIKEKQINFNKPIVTQIVKAEKFYPAEDYHQKYFQKHGE